MDSPITQPVCPMCGRPYYPIAVHGHVQCSVCGVNIEPCCAGAALYCPTAEEAEAQPPDDNCVTSITPR
ncbi:MAG: hypothetical protein RMN52_14265 [Anaerolineae bacterium]|nr:hypothetical protein [Candidatus Roseilinea sp.]MDW8451160.1 hypothetical protein [Anaerolineae bacterium]